MPTKGQFPDRLVANDPDRSFGYVWAIGAGVVAPFTLTSPTSVVTTLDFNGDPNVVPQVFRLPGTGTPFNELYHVGFKLPDNAAAGNWVFTAGSLSWTFPVVAARPARKVKLLPPGTSASKVQEWLQVCDVRLAPGYYEWTSSVSLPALPRILSGYGAFVRRVNNSSSVEYGQRVFWGGRDFTLEGVTLWAENLFFHSGPYSGASGETDAFDTGQYAVLKNCVFRQGSLGYSMRNILVKKCIFDGAGCTEAPNGLYYRNEFRNYGGPLSLGFNGGCNGNLAIVENVFQNSVQGVVFDSTGASYLDAFLYGSRVSTAGQVNQCEALMCEGGGGAHEFSRNLVMNYHTNGVGTCPQIDCPAYDNLFVDMLCRSSGGLNLYGSFPQERNKFSSCEWEGPAYLGALAQNNIFENCAWRWIGPSRANSGGNAIPNYDVLTAINAVGSGAATNTLNTCRFFLGNGLTPAAGVTFTSCKINGVDHANGAQPPL